MTDQQYDQISAYVTGTMPPEEVVQFEAKLRSNAKLAAALETYRLSELALRIDRRRTLLKDLEGVQAQGTIQPDTQIKPLWQQARLWVGVAAAVLITIAIVLIQRPNQPSGNELFAQQFKPYPAVGSLMGPDAEPEPLTGIQAYSRGNYQQASTLFQQTQTKRKLTVEERLYWASAYLSLDSISAAKDLLIPLSLTEGPFQAASQWYLALTLLREENWEASKQLLQQLSAQSTDKYGEDAQRLLNQVEMTP